MTPLPVRSLLLASLLFGTVALAQQNAPVPIPPLPPVPTKTAPTVPGTVPGTTPIPPVTLPPAANPAPPAAPATPAAASTYTVQAGDNPWTIAKKHGIKLDDLLKVNEIKDPKNLKIGDVLKLPEGVASKGAPSAKPAAQVVATPTAPVAGTDSDLYTIKKGDNPWKIAKSLKLDHQKIIQLNPGVDFTKLSIGQQIKVPKKP
jgi:LysM repeat protein